VSVVRVFSAGAAKAVVRALSVDFEAETGARIDATFDAAGAIQRAFEQDRDGDIVILPEAMLDALAGRGLVDRSTIAALGVVATGVAVRGGDVSPRIDDADALREALVAAVALYCPDIERSTAGRHFMRVLTALGIDAASRPKLHAYANGAAAMATLAHEGAPGALGCTQVTEILYTPGVDLVAPLPAPFELSTRYVVAVASRAPTPALARTFAARVTGEVTASFRRAGGFDA
jgi:molybdate transport system substrate-binding protein